MTGSECDVENTKRAKARQRGTQQRHSLCRWSEKQLLNNLSLQNRAALEGLLGYFGHFVFCGFESVFTTQEPVGARDNRSGCPNAAGQLETAAQACPSTARALEVAPRARVRACPGAGKALEMDARACPGGTKALDMAARACPGAARTQI